jgi:hypothetical protein
MTLFFLLFLPIKALFFLSYIKYLRRDSCDLHRL